MYRFGSYRGIVVLKAILSSAEFLLKIKKPEVFCDWMTHKLNFLYFLSILFGGSDANHMML